MQKGNILENLYALFAAGCIGVLWGIANMLYKSLNWEAHKRQTRIMQIAFSFCCALLVGIMLPPDMQPHIRDGILWITGSSAMTIYKFMQNNVVDIMRLILKVPQANQQQSTKEQQDKNV